MDQIDFNEITGEELQAIVDDVFDETIEFEPDTKNINVLC